LRVDAAPVFAALGDSTRLALVQQLSSAGPQSIKQLTANTDVTRQAVTKHLLALHEAGLVRDSREGRERIWEIEPRRLLVASRYLEEVSRRWDDAVERLRAFVEE
jgi:DNA-binding transcriptional ArsR family regulator